MADKPRVKAPKHRTTPDPDEAARRRRAVLLGVAAVGGVAVVAALVAILGLGGGGGPSEEEVRASLEAAGCTLEVAEELPGQHSVADPGDTSDEWNTDPPTTGPHFAVAAIFGIYEEPLEQARLVHNLEHGGIYIQYGEDVPEETVGQLRSFYNRRQTGTIMAPLPRLGDEFALGAWVSDGEDGNGYLAKCRTFDEEAVSSFFRAFQFKAPERFDPSQLQPGR